MNQTRPARLDLAFAGLLVIAGYVVAAVHLAALSWDGSWYLFRSLQDGAPFTPHLRYGTYAVLWLVVQARGMIGDPDTLGIYYGLLMALFPVGSLVLSWYYLRGAQHAALRVWPALGILLAPLPGQFCLISEAALTAQLLWPVLAIVAAGVPGTGAGVWLILLSAELFLIHPTAALVFALAAGFCGWQAWTGRGAARKAWAWAGIFTVLAIGKLVSSILSATDYERSQVSWGQLPGQLADAVPGYPLLLLLAVYLFGFVYPASPGIDRARLSSKSKQRICVLLFAVAVCAGWHWAADPVKWQGALNYRRFVLFAALPLAGMAFRHFRRLARESGNARPFAPFALCAISTVFAVVMATQSLAWSSLLETFTVALARRAPAQTFVAARELPFTNETALRHWTACPLSILLQGRQPRTLFVLKREDIQPQSVQVNLWEQIPLQDGWFTLRSFRSDKAPER